MTPYLFALTFYFIIIGLGIYQKNLRTFLILALMPLVGLSLLKGMVGGDTAFYHQSIDLIRSEDSLLQRFEPLFEVIALVLSQFTNSSTIVLGVVAGMTTLLLFIGAYKLERQPYFFALAIIPYFYLDMTMNGMRYGLAFSLVLWATLFFIRGSKIISYLIVIAAACVQLTSVLLAIMFLSLVKPRWRNLILGILGATLVSLFFGEYVSSKIEDNQALIPESSLAGLAPFLLSVLILSTFWFDLSVRLVARYQMILLAASSILFFTVTQFYYAGLRLQSLNLFLIYLVLASILSKNKIQPERRTIIILFMISLLSAGFRLRNFYNDAGVGESPFVPYHFYWEI
jgi:hypothetical protein